MIAIGMILYIALAISIYVGIMWWLIEVLELHPLPFILILCFVYGFGLILTAYGFNYFGLSEGARMIQEFVESAK